MSSTGTGTPTSQSNAQPIFPLLEWSVVGTFICRCFVFGRVVALVESSHDSQNQ